MQVKHSKVLTILAEHVFETQLIELIERAGASGYSIEEVGRGRGRHGSRAGTLESERLIKIMIVESQQIADAILQALPRSFLPEHGIKVILQDAEVMNWMVPRLS